MEGVTGDNVFKIVKALKKKQTRHRGPTEADPEAKIRRAHVKPFLEPQPHSSSQEPVVLSIEDLDLSEFSGDDDLYDDSDESVDMERDSEDTDSDIIVEE